MYSWLQQEPGPKMLLEALKLYGVTEVPGTGDNPQILAWAREIGQASVYNHDSIAWCGLFMATLAHRAGKSFDFNPLWALNWQKFGTPQKQAMLGDVLTFTRDGGGHVALYVGEDRDAYHILGGNQGDRVSIVRKLKTSLHSISRPPYNEQPSNVRKIILAPNGGLSVNEA
jgi:uncharacterized protein (TIGR02594 family)